MNMKSYEKLYIDGRWVAPVHNRNFETVDPSNEQVIAKVAAATSEDVDLAVKAARKAFDEGPWPRMSGTERAAVLRRIGRGIRDRLQELAEIEVRDNGKPLPEALWDLGDAAGCFEFYAGLAEKLDENCETPVALSDDRF